MGSVVLCGHVIPGEDAVEMAKRALAELIALLSEDEYCSGWMVHIEHVLWERVAKWAEMPDEAKPTTYMLALLAETSGHWCHWPDDKPKAEPISLDDWLVKHAAWKDSWSKLNQDTNEAADDLGNE